MIRNGASERVLLTQNLPAKGQHFLLFKRFQSLIQYTKQTKYCRNWESLICLLNFQVLQEKFSTKKSFTYCLKKVIFVERINNTYYLKVESFDQIANGQFWTKIFRDQVRETSGSTKACGKYFYRICLDEDATKSKWKFLVH